MALARPMVHHRSEEFERAWNELGRLLGQAFSSSGAVAVLTSSGTGAMEAAVVNHFAPGDRVLVPVGGKFSRRWAEICGAYGVEASRLDLGCGESPGPERIAEALGREPVISGVLLTQCESSTGALADIQSAAAAVRECERRAGREILVVVDAVTSLCVDPLESDRWGVDVAVGASQKGLLGPPGLAFVAVGERARAAWARASRRAYYFDLARYLGSPRPPFTPSVPVVLAVLESLKRILGLGLGRVLAANAASARALGAVVRAAGLAPVAASSSAGVVAFWTGEAGADSIRLELRRDHGIVVAGGQDQLAGKALRVSGIGKTAGEIAVFAGAFADVLNKLGWPFDRSKLPGNLGEMLEETRIWE